MTSSKIRNPLDILVKIGAVIFVAAIPVSIAGNILFGDRGVAWPTVVMIYPALMIIGAAVGFSGAVRLFKNIRSGELLVEGAYSALYSVVHILVFSSLFFFSLFMESKAIGTLLELLR